MRWLIVSVLALFAITLAAEGMATSGTSRASRVEAGMTGR